MSCSHWVSVSEPYPSVFNVEFGLYDAYIRMLDHMSQPAWLAHLVTCIKHCYFHHVHLLSGYRILSPSSSKYNYQWHNAWVMLTDEVGKESRWGSGWKSSHIVLPMCCYLLTLTLQQTIGQLKMLMLGIKGSHHWMGAFNYCGFCRSLVNN